MPTLGFTELALILVIVLILFGAGRLPQVFESLGKGIRAFRQASKDDEPLEVDSAKQISKASEISEAEEVKTESSVS